MRETEFNKRCFFSYGTYHFIICTDKEASRPSWDHSWVGFPEQCCWRYLWWRWWGTIEMGAQLKLIWCSFAVGWNWIEVIWLDSCSMLLSLKCWTPQVLVIRLLKISHKRLKGMKHLGLPIVGANQCSIFPLETFWLSITTFVLIGNMTLQRRGCDNSPLPILLWAMSTFQLCCGLTSAWGVVCCGQIWYDLCLYASRW